MAQSPSVPEYLLLLKPISDIPGEGVGEGSGIELGPIGGTVEVSIGFIMESVVELGSIRETVEVTIGFIMESVVKLE